MPLPSSFVYALFPIQEIILDPLTGSPAANGTVGFYSDPAFTQLKTIYQQSQSSPGTFTPLQNPLILDGIGSYQDETGNEIIPFLYPYVGTPDDPIPGDVQLYYIQALNSNGDTILTRMDWPPNQPDFTNPSSATTPESQNLLTNPQFNEVLFPNISGGYVFSVSGTNTITQIAPGWYFNTTGTGSITVQQLDLGTQTPSESPYALSILVGSGITGITLFQRVFMSPRLAINGYLAGYFEATSNNGSTVTGLTLSYIPAATSGGATITIIPAGTPTPVDGSYGIFYGGSDVLGTSGAVSSDSPTTPSGGYVDIALNIPPLSSISVTSFQVLSVSTPSELIEFIQISTPQQQAQMFWYYQPKLNYKPIPSYLTGWDFPLNPSQFGPGNPSSTIGPIAIGGADYSYYVWDQTILFQSVDNVLGVTRNTSTNGITITGGATPSTFALIQYLPIERAREMLSQRLSFEIQGFCTTTGGTLNATVSLYYTTASSLPVIQANPISNASYSLVSSVAATTAIPTVGGGGNYGTWTTVPRSGFGNTPAFQLNANAASFGFNGWQALASASTTAKFIAVVVAFDAIGSGQNVTLNYASLVPGDIPTRPAPQTPDDVLRECQYYFEMSWDSGGYIGQVTPNGAPAAPQGVSIVSTTATLVAEAFTTPYTVKRAVPNVTYYSAATGSSGVVNGVVLTNGPQTANGDITVAAWGGAVNNRKYNCMIPSQTTTSVSAGGGGTSVANSYINYNFTSDARLGVV
jgi:hypothetical protein